jgi:hypothetical protein
VFFFAERIEKYEPQVLEMHYARPLNQVLGKKVDSKTHKRAENETRRNEIRPQSQKFQLAYLNFRLVKLPVLEQGLGGILEGGQRIQPNVNLSAEPKNITKKVEKTAV